MIEKWGSPNCVDFIKKILIKIDKDITHNFILIGKCNYTAFTFNSSFFIKLFMHFLLILNFYYYGKDNLSTLKQIGVFSIMFAHCK